MSYITSLLERRVRRYGLLGSFTRLTTQTRDILLHYGICNRAASSLRRFVSVAQRFDARVTVPIVASLSRRYTGLVKEVLDGGHEVACHGLIHTLYDKMRLEEQYLHFKTAKALLESISGAKIIGFRSPYSRFNEETHLALAKAGFKYDSSMRANGRPCPFSLKIDGAELLEIPWFDADDVIVDELHLPPSRISRSWISRLRHAKPGEVYVFDLHPVRMGLHPYVEVLRSLLSYARESGMRVLCLEEVYRFKSKLSEAPVLTVSGDVDCLRACDFVLRVFKLA